MNLESIEIEKLCDSEFFDYCILNEINKSQQVKSDSIQIIMSLSKHVFSIRADRGCIEARLPNGDLKRSIVEKEGHQYILSFQAWLNDLMDILPNCFIANPKRY